MTELERQSARVDRAITKSLEAPKLRWTECKDGSFVIEESDFSYRDVRPGNEYRCPRCGGWIKALLTKVYDAQHDEVVGWEGRCPNAGCRAKLVVIND